MSSILGGSIEWAENLNNLLNSFNTGPLSLDFRDLKLK